MQMLLLLKVGRGMRRPIPVQRGIRQGCLLSSMRYALAFEPLLNQMRRNVTGFSFSQNAKEKVTLSAYADDVTVLVIRPG